MADFLSSDEFLYTAAYSIVVKGSPALPLLHFIPKSERPHRLMTGPLGEMDKAGMHFMMKDHRNGKFRELIWFGSKVTGPFPWDLSVVSVSSPLMRLE